MKKLFKFICWAVLAVIILIALAITVLIFWFNPNNYKANIASIVSQKTGREFSITGNITWSIWPNMGLNIAGATLANPPGMAGPEFLHVQSANLSIALLPLLAKQVQVDALTVQGLEVNLIQNSATSNNWTFAHKEAKAQTNHVAKNNQNMTDDMFGFHVDRIVIENASLRFIDNVNHQKYQIKPLSLSATNISLNSAFPVKLNFAWQSTSPQMSGQMGFTTTALINLSQNEFVFDELKLNSQMNMVHANGQPLPIEMVADGKLMFNSSTQDFVLDPMAITVNNLLTANAHLQVKKALSKPEYEGEIAISPVDLNKLIQSLNVGVIALPNSEALNNFSLNAQFSGNAQQINIQNISSTVYQSTLQGSIILANMVSPHVITDLNLNQIDVANYVNLYGAGLPMNGLHVQADVRANGWSNPVLSQTLNGTSYISVQQATLQGIDIGALIKGVSQALNNLVTNGDFASAFKQIQQQLPQFGTKQQPINPNSGQQTQFTAFSSQSNIVNGVLNNTLALTGQNFHMQGSGTVNFTKGANVNYKLVASSLQDNNQNPVNNIQIPFKITGTPQNLQYGVDIVALEAELQPIFLQQVKNRLQQQIQKSASELLKNIIQQ